MSATFADENRVSIDVDSIIRYEEGEMNDDETIVFFQKLVDSGMAWKLQGSYGRAAEAMINDGLITARKR